LRLPHTTCRSGDFSLPATEIRLDGFNLDIDSPRRRIVMRDREPTIRSRELGDGLRAAMERAGLNNRRTAELLEWPEPRLSKVLHGRRGVTEVEVAEFLAVCGTRGKERTRLLDITRDQDTPGWLQQFGARLPKQLKTFIDHENKATDITDFATVVLPGILQTGEYARAVRSRIGWPLGSLGPTCSAG
jgi:hypothetical protein